jgi:hypothetical protein
VKADGFTVLFAGGRAREYERVFGERGVYAMPEGVAPDESTPPGFGVEEAPKQIRLRPSRVETTEDIRPATDSWPFLYLRNPMLPDLSWRGMLGIGLIAAALLRLFGWRTGRSQLTRRNGVMFFLGAGFMLLETKAVVHLALVYGSTWTVNTAVFSAILVVILLANLFVLRREPRTLTPFYWGLVLTLVLNAAVPLNSFLGLPAVLQNIAAPALVISPVFFAGVIFAVLLRQEREAEQALAYNTAGAILGGMLEITSMWIGFQYLVLVAAVLYGITWAMARSKAAVSEPVGVQ